MTNSAKSILYFSLYLMPTGIFILLWPQIFSVVMDINETTIHFIRLMGIVSFILGFYYLRAALENNVGFFRTCIFGRLIFLAGSILVYSVFEAPAIFVLFGAVDGIGAIITYRYMKQDSLVDDDGGSETLAKYD
ncbi:MAG: hypothetical protein JKY67_11355 [Pseudomonadales bacterium]|nr:hypothetical protein [Pseudomonadales bacterium]